MKVKYVAGLIIIAAFVVWGAFSFMATTIKYVPIAEAAESTGVVQVMGQINFDAMQYDAEKSRLEFEIIDPEDKTLTNRLKIIYTGVVPGNFEQATSVVAKGRYQAGAFIAEELLVKCPSKYQGYQGVEGDA